MSQCKRVAAGCQRLLAMALLLHGTAGVAWASEPAPLPARGPIPFAAYDRDGDGLISEQEFDAVRAQRIADRAASGARMGNLANAPTFADLDGDHNGWLTPEELAAGQAAQMEQRTGSPPPSRPAGAMGPGGMPSFAEFDLNSDGVLTEQEFNQARSERMAARAAQGYPLRNAANAPPFTDFDANGDGQVTPEEFAAAQAAHRATRVPAAAVPAAPAR